MLIPGTLYWVLLPKTWQGGRFDRAMTVSGFALFVFIIGFTMIGELLFWNEFGARFNFIAVDYLVYAREVAGNIWESYPVGLMLAGLAGGAVVLTILFGKPLLVAADIVRLRGRAAILASLALTAFLVNDVSKASWTEMNISTPLARSRRHDDSGIDGAKRLAQKPRSLPSVAPGPVNRLGDADARSRHDVDFTWARAQFKRGLVERQSVMNLGDAERFAEPAGPRTEQPFLKYSTPSLHRGNTVYRL